MGPKRGRQYDIAGVLQSGHVWRQAQEALLLCRATVEQFRQFCEIERHLSRLVHHQEAGVGALAFNPRSTQRFWLTWHAGSIGRKVSRSACV